MVCIVGAGERGVAARLPILPPADAGSLPRAVRAAAAAGLSALLALDSPQTICTPPNKLLCCTQQFGYWRVQLLMRTGKQYSARQVDPTAVPAKAARSNIVALTAILSVLAPKVAGSPRF